jgi:glycine oxidase
MSGRAKVTVAGAGALGLSAALALAEAGCEVTLHDPAPERSASAVAAGMIAPVFEAVLDPEAAPAFDLLLAARDLWPGFAARAGVELDRSGALAVGDPAWLAMIEAGLVRLGVHGIELPHRTAADLAPGLSEAFSEALLVREDWRVQPAAALAALRRAAEAAGIRLNPAPVAAFGDADWLVVATGADASLAAVAPELGLLTPIKGQILRYAGCDAGRVSVRGQGAYGVPAEGGLAIGATMECGVADPAPDPAQLGPLQAAGARLFPTLQGRRPEILAGVRAATPDGLPLAGRSATPRVILATGARRNGWLLAPLVGQAVAACVTGGEAGPHAARLAPARFDTRGAKGEA